MQQKDLLLPSRDILNNVCIPLLLKGMSAKEAQAEARVYLKDFGLDGFEKYYPRQLSGGMKQRAALLRTYLFTSDIMLMDEPFAALDSQTKSIQQLELQQIWLETQKTIIFVTHNVEEAVFLADRVIVMSANPGKVKKDFRIQLARPRQQESLDLAYMVADIVKELKEEVEKVAKAEYDSDWHFKKDPVLSDPNNNMGIGL
jgi:NitT/TauT family transport system ATP-binding protein